ncbi:hypothetical protein LUZ60_001710 [Juncus effusus]|nr:hypothetical protein LUZ60_001710 [Juncus effusus]
MEKSKIHANAAQKSGLSGRYTSKNSPSNRRFSSGLNRSTRKDSRGVSVKIQCLRTNRVVFGLILIAIWGYIGFHFQSRWAHYDDSKKEGFGFKGHNGKSASARLQEEIKKAEALLKKNSSYSVDLRHDLTVNEIKIVVLATEERKVESNDSNLNSNSKISILKEDLDVNKTVDTNLPNVSNPKFPNSDKNETTILEIKGKQIPKSETNFDSNSTKNKTQFMQNTLNPNPPSKKTRKSRKTPKKSRVITTKDPNTEFEEGLIPKKNTSYGLTVGPFTQTADSILQFNPQKNQNTCDEKGLFAKQVFSRAFVLIFHELSLTGAPISMMELASELIGCGARVSVVAVNRKGGLLQELEKRGIRVIKDRLETSFKAALKADLVIAGSAVCSSWIEQYLSHHPSGSNNILWWLMENRREYFDRSKHLLNKVKMLAFLSEYQLKKWAFWLEKENIKLNSEPMLVPLSVNDELAFVAGIKCSLNDDEFNVGKMNVKRGILRSRVREEMGLGENDVLVLSLSSINPGKGQKLLLEASLLVSEDKVDLSDFEIGDLFEDEMINQTLVENKELTLVKSLNETMETKVGDKNLTLVIPLNKINETKEIKIMDLDKELTLVTPLNQTNETKEMKIKDLITELARVTPLNQTNETKEIKNNKTSFENEASTLFNSLNQTNSTNPPKNETRVSLNQTTNPNPNSTKRRRFWVRKNLRGLLTEKQESKQKLKVLIGSLGSKSNKVPYIKAIVRFITRHKNMSDIVMWTPATTRVASLYAAADVYVMNAQGIGETFGRVTIEAMAFGLPVLGTDAGGTKEIVKDRITGFLHPVGRDGIETLAENLLFLVKNPAVRVKVGGKGRQLVIDKYLKNNTYNNFARVLSKCMTR